ncbi:hypothetical protein HDU93_006043 [Gonapodya sp. JEL0774]|nr:hypothetical protein HDU93_006043 [Gonapodya sp. JEL0774]
MTGRSEDDPKKALGPPPTLQETYTDQTTAANKQAPYVSPEQKTGDLNRPLQVLTSEITALKKDYENVRLQLNRVIEVNRHLQNQIDEREIRHEETTMDPGLTTNQQSEIDSLLSPLLYQLDSFRRQFHSLTNENIELRTEMDTIRKQLAEQTTKPTSAAQTFARSTSPQIKASPLPELDGDTTKYKAWRSLLGHHMILRGHEFSNALTRTTWVATSLRGTAQTWYTTWYNREIAADGEFEWVRFLRDMDAVFGDPLEEQNARYELGRLRMKDTERFGEYLIRFQALRDMLEYPDRALIAPFEQGLWPSIKEKLRMSSYDSEDLQSTINMARKLAITAIPPTRSYGKQTTPRSQITTTEQPGPTTQKFWCDKHKENYTHKTEECRWKQKNDKEELSGTGSTAGNVRVQG